METITKYIVIKEICTLRKAILRGLVALLALLPITSCFEVNQDIILNYDLSGKVQLSMTYDLEVFIEGVAQFQKEMMEKEGKKVDMESLRVKLRRDFLKKGTSSINPPNLKRFSKTAPSGIKPISVKYTRRGFKVAAQFNFAFDDIRKLTKLDLSKAGGRQKFDPTQKFFNRNQPFSGMTFREEGKFYILEIPLGKPGKKGRPNPFAGPSGKDKEKMAKYFKGMGMNFSFTTPYKVVEQNAHKVRGNRLTWNYNFEKITKLAVQDKHLSIRVKMEKSE